MAAPPVTPDVSHSAVQPLDGLCLDVSGPPGPGDGIVIRHLRLLGATDSTGTTGDSTSPTGPISSTDSTDSTGYPGYPGSTASQPALKTFRLSPPGPHPRTATARTSWGTIGVDEATVQAVTGVMAVHRRRDGTPHGLGADFTAAATGVLTVQALLAGYLARVRGAPATDATVTAERAALLAISPYLAAAGADTPETSSSTLSPGGLPFASADEGLFEPEGTGPQDDLPPWTLTPLTPPDSEPPATYAAYARLSAARMGAPAPLAGLTVLEAGHGVQVSLAAHLLGLLGAEVVRVEPPGGDPLRGAPPTCTGVSARWLALNRGKTAVEIDVGSAPDRNRLRAMAAEADVFLHDWVPGSAAALGLGHADLAAVNSALVHARTPHAPMAPPLDILGGLLGAEAVLAGLLLRHRTGTGVRVAPSPRAAADLIATATRARAPSGFRQPLRTADGWIALPDDETGAAPPPGDLVNLPTETALWQLYERGLSAVPVVTDLAGLLATPHIRRDPHGAPIVPAPWVFV
ncbi:CoA transferase [Streptomyces sp. NPDC048290]|uniref:CoA transferase n=1 Tax=Streptomyces sp. NPDC048290 TaxID=3155811 RepID=UPI003436E850